MTEVCYERQKTIHEQVRGYVGINWPMQQKLIVGYMTIYKGDCKYVPKLADELLRCFWYGWRGLGQQTCDLSLHPTFRDGVGKQVHLWRDTAVDVTQWVGP